MWFCLKHIKGDLQEDQESENQFKMGKHTSLLLHGPHFPSKKKALFSFSFFFLFNVYFEGLYFRNAGPGRGGCSLRQASPQERTPPHTPPPKSLCPPSSECLCQASIYNLMVQTVLLPGPELLCPLRTSLCGFAAAGFSHRLPHHSGHGAVVSRTVPQPRSRPVTVATP